MTDMDMTSTHGAPFAAGTRVRVEWPDLSVSEGELFGQQGDAGTDLYLRWAGQGIHFWDSDSKVLIQLFADATSITEIPANEEG